MARAAPARVEEQREAARGTLAVSSGARAREARGAKRRMQEKKEQKQPEHLARKIREREEGACMGRSTHELERLDRGDVAQRQHDSRPLELRLRVRKRAAMLVDGKVALRPLSSHAMFSCVPLVQPAVHGARGWRLVGGAATLKMELGRLRHARARRSRRASVVWRWVFVVSSQCAL